MDNELFGMKELYDVILKATFNIDIDGKSYVTGEVVAAFDKIMISNFTPRKSYRFARGGLGNSVLMSWEDTSDIVFNFDHGVFSKTQLALLSNSKLINNETDTRLISHSQTLTTDEDGKIELKFTPAAGTLFIYDVSTGNKITSFTENGNTVTLLAPFLEVLVRYQFEYTENYSLMSIGKELVSGYLELEGKTKLVDNQDGLVTTGIIHIPRLKLMSNLVLRLGDNAPPQVASFSGIGIPVGDKREKYVCEILYLGTNIEAT